MNPIALLLAVAAPQTSPPVPPAPPPKPPKVDCSVVVRASCVSLAPGAELMSRELV